MWKSLDILPECVMFAKERGPTAGSSPSAARSIWQRPRRRNQPRARCVPEQRRLGRAIVGGYRAQAGSALVRFTDAGWDYLRAAHDLKIEIESEYAQLLDRDAFETLCVNLARIIDYERSRSASSS